MTLPTYPGPGAPAAELTATDGNPLTLQWNASGIFTVTT
jgi:hypothetical protein